MKFLTLPVALGCISLLYLLHLSACLALPARYQDLPPRPREPPDRYAPDEDQKWHLLDRILTEAKSASSTHSAEKEGAADPPGGRRHPINATKSQGWLLLRSPGSVSHPDSSRPRLKRHAHFRSHRPQLMRVGCSLGTCQVQNLSHRLWQLMGQSGREDTSPINLNSPHSYG